MQSMALLLQSVPLPPFLLTHKTKCLYFPTVLLVGVALIQSLCLVLRIVPQDTYMLLINSPLCIHKGLPATLAVNFVGPGHPLTYPTTRVFGNICIYFQMYTKRETTAINHE